MTSSTDLELAPLVRDWRRIQGLSLEKAGRLLGVAHTTVRDWERGRQPRLAHLLRLQEHLLAPTGSCLALTRAAARQPVRVASLPQARAHRGLSQRQLARVIYVSPSSVAAWESGRRRPALWDVKRLSLILGYPPGLTSTWFMDAPHRCREGVRLAGLASLRQQSGVAQGALANTLGITTATWGAWESGRRIVPYTSLEPIAVALGTNISQLLRTAMQAPVPDITSLRTMRQTAGRTQHASARTVGVAVYKLARIERGAAPLTMALATELADRYEVPVAHVIRAGGLHGAALFRHDSWLEYDLPELLGVLRTDIGLTCRRAAQLIGVGVATLRHWEHGRLEPNAAQRRALARAYHAGATHPTSPAPCTGCAILENWPEVRAAATRGRPPTTGRASDVGP